ncbi:hypothetical protein CYMTET_57040 [Cymbomonas tetramitiformis]|uniref:Uncharacterized protein n=1 Tax=Cymbomonas tetramitiformis TaxID=36881 RepID=A0AAE0BBG9_9CHLO|nr:hypothetical protein CYMTET_57040 [Cymbomonas tetramitiformis]
MLWVCYLRRCGQGGDVACAEAVPAALLYVAVFGVMIPVIGCLAPRVLGEYFGGYRMATFHFAGMPQTPCTPPPTRECGNVRAWRGSEVSAAMYVWAWRGPEVSAASEAGGECGNVCVGRGEAGGECGNVWTWRGPEVDAAMCVGAAGPSERICVAWRGPEVSAAMCVWRGEARSGVRQCGGVARPGGECGNVRWAWAEGECGNVCVGVAEPGGECGNVWAWREAWWRGNVCGRGEACG